MNTFPVGSFLPSKIVCFQQFFDVACLWLYYREGLFLKISLRCGAKTIIVCFKYLCWEGLHRSRFDWFWNSLDTIATSIYGLIYSGSCQSITIVKTLYQKKNNTNLGTINYNAILKASVLRLRFSSSLSRSSVFMCLIQIGLYFLCFLWLTVCLDGSRIFW